MRRASTIFFLSCIMATYVGRSNSTNNAPINFKRKMIDRHQFDTPPPPSLYKHKHNWVRKKNVWAADKAQNDNTITTKSFQLVKNYDHFECPLQSHLNKINNTAAMHQPPTLEHFSTIFDKFTAISKENNFGVKWKC